MMPGLLKDISDLVRNKNEAIQIAINALECFCEPCNGKNCCLESNPPYHWRGCEANLKPLIDSLKAIKKMGTL